MATIDSVAALVEHHAGNGAVVLRDTPTARIEQECAWAFGHMPALRLRHLAHAFRVAAKPTEPEDRNDRTNTPAEWRALAAQGGTAYLSAEECARLARDLADVWRERLVAAEARTRFLRVMHLGRDEVQQLIATLDALGVEAEAASLRPGYAAPIVLMHASGLREQEGVTCEVALQVAVLFGIVEDLEEDEVIPVEIC